MENKTAAGWRTMTVLIWVQYIHCIYIQPRNMSRMQLRSVLSRVLQVWIQSFPSRLVVLPGLKCSVLLLIVGRRIVGFIPFPSVLALCEIPRASSRIWTWNTLSILYDTYHYTMNASTVYINIYMFVYIYIYISFYYPMPNQLMLGTILFSDFLSTISMWFKIQKRAQCKIMIKWITEQIIPYKRKTFKNYPFFCNNIYFSKPSI